nr:jerky protein homolog-like [Procambarus clarkii]
MSQSSIHGIEGIKQKRKHLSIDQKVDLTEKAERGYSVTQLAQEFNIGKATICDIKKQKDNIKKFFAQTQAIGNRKTMKPAKLEENIPGCKVKKERISALLCRNADGSHRTKYAIVGKSANLRALKNCMNRLPVIYYNTKNAWFTQITFEDWFQNHFCKENKDEDDYDFEGFDNVIFETFRDAGEEDLQLSDVNEWLNNDADDPGYGELTENEIIQCVIGNNDEDVEEEDDSVLSIPYAASLQKVNDLLDLVAHRAKGTAVSVDSIRNAAERLAVKLNIDNLKASAEWNEWLNNDAEDPGYGELTDNEIIQCVTGNNDEDVEQEDDSVLSIPYAASLQKVNDLLDLVADIKTNKVCTTQLNW